MSWEKERERHSGQQAGDRERERERVVEKVRKEEDFGVEGR